MKKRNLIIMLSTIVILIVAVVLITKKKKTTEIESNEIVIGYPTLRIALPVFVAQEMGYFKEQELNISLKSYETAQPMMDALVSGKINIGGFCALPITFGAMARSKTPLLFFGGMYENDKHPISILIVKDSLKIKTIKDLEGKRIGILPTRAYEVWLQQILISNDIDPNNVIIRQVAPNLQADAISSGSVDALFTNDPAATITLSLGLGVPFSSEALVPKFSGFNPFYFGSFNIRKDYAEAHPDIVKKIAIALDKAMVYINQNPDEAKLAMKKYLPEPHQKFVVNFPNAFYKTCSEVSNKDLESMKNYYLNLQVLPMDIDIINLQYNY